MGKAVRVLQVMSILNQGGAENMVMNLYRAIDRDHIQFDFIVHTNDRGAFDDEAESLGATIYHVPKYTGTNHFQYVKWWKDFFAEHSEYEILHSHIRSCAAIYLPIAKKYGLKTIIHSHSTSNGHGFSALVKKAYQYPLRYQADYLFACSREAGEWLFGKKAVDKDNFKVVFNGIDCNKFQFNAESRSRIRKKYGIDNNVVIGHIGRHTLAKNPIFLIEVFAEVYKQDHSARLLQVGEGELTEQMKQRCRDLGVEQAVIFAGVHNDVEKYYSAMDVFLFPSVWEGFGMSVVEAQTSGLHCVVSEAVPALVDVGAGLVHVNGSDKPADIWARSILSYASCGREKCPLLSARLAAFDITSIAKRAEAFYISVSGK